MADVAFRDRIKELRRVPAGELQANPKNWRTHPKAQQDALKAVLSEIGYSDALIARELPDGSLELIDGHLRADTTPDQEVPVLIVDLTDAEAEKMLLLLDPLASMAEADGELLRQLMASCPIDDVAVNEILDGLADAHPISEAADDIDSIPQGADVGEMTFRVIVKVDGEAEQAALITRLEGEGLECKPLMS